MSLLDQVIGYGTHAARPVAGSAGRVYFESDTGLVVRDNGTSWDDVVKTGEPILYDNLLTVDAVGPIIIDSIPQQYRDLRLEITARGVADTPGESCYCLFNGDDGANYDLQQVYFYGGGGGSVAYTGQFSASIGNFTKPTAPMGMMSQNTCIIHNYTSTSQFKIFRAHAMNFVDDANLGIELFDGQWRSTAALTSLSVTLHSTTFAAGSRVRLYGRY